MPATSIINKPINSIPSHYVSSNHHYDHPQYLPSLSKTLENYYPQPIPTRSTYPSAYYPITSNYLSPHSPPCNQYPSTIHAHESSSTTSSDSSASPMQHGQSPKQGKKSLKQPVAAVSNGIVKKKRKTKKNKIIIATSELVRCMILPQTVAAKKLKVSLSTLKRRFYELGIGRWPAVQPASHDKNGQSTHQHSDDDVSYSSMSYVDSTDATPEQKLDLTFILHKNNTVEPSVVDNLSMTILKLAFTLNTSEEK